MQRDRTRSSLFPYNEQNRRFLQPDGYFSFSARATKAEGTTLPGFKSSLCSTQALGRVKPSRVSYAHRISWLGCTF